jgi:tetratricopeptide (TPR) repeat protein
MSGPRNELLLASPRTIRYGAILMRATRYPGVSAVLLLWGFLTVGHAGEGDGRLTAGELGVRYVQEGRWDLAMEELIKAIAEDPRNAVWHNSLGTAAAAKNQPEMAIRELETAIQLDPAYLDAHFNLAVLLAIRFPPDKENARKYYQRALELGAEKDTALETLIGISGAAAGAQGSGALPSKAQGAEKPRAEASPTNQPVGNNLPPDLLPLVRKAKER